MIKYRKRFQNDKINLLSENMLRSSRKSNTGLMFMIDMCICNLRQDLGFEDIGRNTINVIGIKRFQTHDTTEFIKNLYNTGNLTLN